ncbi:MAG TPA: glycosyltransferase [Gemmatimonadaceae bacterium]|nr:glycosyltransferase [Gemmatimonadaceae bacterium]
MRTSQRRVLYLQFANPAAYPPVVHGAQILAERGAEVRILGTRPVIGGDITMPAHPRIGLTQLREGRGISQKIAFLRFALLATWMAIRFRPDWLYVSDTFAAPAGLLATLLARVPVVYHEHDVHTEASPSILVQFCMRARRALARRARAVVVPSLGRAAYVARTLEVQAVVVMNCPRLMDVRDRRASAEGPLRVAYQGTLVPGRLPFALADAVAELRGAVVLTLGGYETAGAQGHVNALVARADARGAPGSIVNAGPLLSRDRLLEFCANAEVGLAFVPRNGGDVNMQTMVGASNKAFDYLACGVPLLVSDLEDWRETFVRPGYAIAAAPEDPRSIADALRWLLEHRSELGAMGVAGKLRIVDEWNYERQFAPVAAQLLGDAESGATAMVVSLA